MTNNTLKIGFKNLDTRNDETLTIKASNVYMLVNKYVKLLAKNIYIDSYNLINSE